MSLDEHQALLAAELRALGAHRVEEDRGAVRFAGDLEVAYRACLWSRIASRVLLVIGRVWAQDSDRLFREARRLDWRAHLGPQSRFRVDFVGRSETFRNTRYGAQCTKDAIMASFDRQRPQVDVKRPDVRINVHLRQNRAQVAIDLSGDPLHLRTPGRKGGPAPLRENLAAALLHLAEWPRLAAEGAALVDPMCGSGTLLAEAAGMAMDRAPGLQRPRWGFEGWPGHAEPTWRHLLREAQQRAEAGGARTLRIRGSDLSRDQVARARHNLAALGVEDARLAVRDIAELPPVATSGGLVVLNPPYGERLGEGDDLARLYGVVGDVLRRRCLGSTGWVLAPERRLASAVGLRPSRRIPIHNGPIECRWLCFPIAEGAVARDQRAGRTSTER